MRRYKQLTEYIGNHFKAFIFIAIFYSLWLFFKYALSFEPKLVSFPGRMIGEATLNAYDINKRIGFFYKSGLVFMGGLFLISYVFMHTEKIFKNFLISAEIQIINYTSFAGIIFYFFNLWSKNFAPSFELIYCIHFLVIIGFFIKNVLFRNYKNHQLFDVSFYAISLVLSVAGIFFLREISLLFGVIPKWDFSISIFVLSLGFLLSMMLYYRKKDFIFSKAAVGKLFFILLPLTLIPLISVVKDEVYLILNRYQIYFFSPKKLYLIFIICLFLFVYIRYLLMNKGSLVYKGNIKQLIAKRYFPLFIVGIVSFVFYQAFIVMSDEMFEAGNRILPLMEFSKFGVLPIFEKFNSHLLSELFFGSIYAFLNGIHTREMYIYDFVYQVFWALMAYGFMYKLIRNAYISLFLVLFFPLIGNLLSDYTIIALIGVFILDKIIHEKPSFKNYLLLFFSFLFLILWRIDIGYPACISGIFCLLLFLLQREEFVIKWPLFFKTLASVLASLIVSLFFIGWYRGISVIEKLWNALNYLGSAQSYGLTNYGDASTSAFKIQYYIFPMLMILGFATLLVFYKRLNISRNQRFIYLSFLFLSIYYFVNFQRGLVRHGFIEGHDDNLSSFAFFILSAGVFLFYRKKPQAYRLIGFVFISVFILMNYKFPALQAYDNIYNQTFNKFRNSSAIECQKNLVRCVDNTHYEELHAAEFKKLISQNLKENQSFIDFANMPILYYFTGKVSPSYFYQNPLTIHNDYLQKQFLLDLKNYDAPFLVFSNFPLNWWDEVDGVPNTMRHYRLSEYFYKNYKPFVIVDNLCVWKRNDFKINNGEKSIYSYYLKKDSLPKSAIKIIQNVHSLKGKKYFLKIHWLSDVPEIELHMRGELKNIKADYSSDIDHMAYYMIKEDFEAFSFLGDKNILSLNFIECNFVPDFYSSYSRTNDLKSLPYIWATYDKAFLKEKELLNLLPFPLFLKGNKIEYFNFKNIIDKNSGNLISISLDVDNDEDYMMDLLYGSSKTGYKGSYKFLIPAGKGLRTFAVRISSQYNWYSTDVDYIALLSKAGKDLSLKKLLILKAESNEL